MKAKEEWQKEEEKKTQRKKEECQRDLAYHLEADCIATIERVQKGIAHWNKQNNDVPAPNCMLKVQGKIIKDEGYK